MKVTKSVLTVLLCCTAIVTYGCGGGGGDGGNSNDNGGGGNTISADDCANLSEDLAFSVNEGTEDGVVASAVTNDCEQLAALADGGELKQVAIAFEGEQSELIFDESGNLVAMRTDDQTATFSESETLSSARVEITDNATGETEGAANFAVERDDTNARRTPLQDVDSLESLCDTIQFRDIQKLLAGFTSNCDASSADYCQTNLKRAAEVALKWCTEDAATEVASIEDTVTPEEPVDVELAIEGFATTREGSSGQTTIILTAVTYGGQGGATATWELTSGSLVRELQQLPGNAAVGDTDSTDTLVFTVTATDLNGNSATDDVEVNFGTGGYKVLIAVVNPTPDIGETSFFSATGENLPEDASYYWNFGDGGFDSGKDVSYAYGDEGCYPVTVQVTSVNGDSSDTVNITTTNGNSADCGTSGGNTSGSGGTVNFGDFYVDINIGSPDSMSVGESRTLSVSTDGAVGDVELTWGIVDGPGELSDGDSLSAQDVDFDIDVIFSETPALEAFEEGVIYVGVLAYDGAGQIGQAIRPIPVFGDTFQLFASIVGPLQISLGETGTLSAFVVPEDTGNISYNWYVYEGDATITSPYSATTEIAPYSQGFMTVALYIYDNLTGLEHTTFFGISSCSDDDPYCGYSTTCIPDDGYCDEGCDPVDTDCQEFCVDGDGLCDPYCDPVDADCDSNEDVCEQTLFCCPDDGFCDQNCPEPDAECDFCGSDGVCVYDCLEADPDCNFDCDVTFECDPDCPDDPDCQVATNDSVCAETGLCCQFDTFCDLDCPDPYQELYSDCDNQTICDFTGGIENFGFCCEGDGYCDECPVEEDSDCSSSTGCPIDGFCDAACDGFDPDCCVAIGLSTDCTNADVCSATGGDGVGFCCDFDGFCDNCPESDPDCF